jgi:hypothetical protein
MATAPILSAREVIMNDTKADSNAQSDARQPATLPPSKPRRHTSMHEGVAPWCDCCSCEAEPYWQAVADELGIDLGSDYEDEL